MFSIIVLVIVLILIALRQSGKLKIQIWQIMLLGALAVIITGQISFNDALGSINLDIMAFLFSMFIIGVALEESGYLAHISYKIFKRAKTANQLILFILFGMGFASVILMNDTVAIIGTPIVLLLAKKHEINPRMLLIALAFAVTIGSVTSPLGNPQNFLIATEGNINNSFLTFLQYLFLPTLINLFIAFFVLKLFYKDNFKKIPLSHSQEPIKNHKLAVLSKWAVFLLLTLIFLKILISLSGLNFDLKLVYITGLIAIIVLIFSEQRFFIVRKIDWGTLIFFAAMFILMESVWSTGFFQLVIEKLNVDLVSMPMILLVSVLLSQLISNVPLVALYLPILTHAGASVHELMLLAVGSTIAGNLLILGAASNVIIIQNAEKRSGETINFMEFAKVGIPLTILNILVYLVFFVLLF